MQFVSTEILILENQFNLESGIPFFFDLFPEPGLVIIMGKVPVPIPTPRENPSTN